VLGLVLAASDAKGECDEEAAEIDPLIGLSSFSSDLPSLQVDHGLINLPSLRTEKSNVDNSSLAVEDDPDSWLIEHSSLFAVGICCIIF